MYKKFKLIFLVLALIVIAGVSLGFYYRSLPEHNPIEDDSDSIIVTPSYIDDLIYVDSPQAGQVISSPLMISGTARGNWFFEATAPVSLVNWDGLIIAQGYITAQDDPNTEIEETWMSEDFVPFKGELEFSLVQKEDSNTFLYPLGALILQKDNPSGLVEYDEALEIGLLYY